jgi:hypothetical protein
MLYGAVNDLPLLLNVLADGILIELGAIWYVSAAACFYDPSFLASMIYLRATVHGISFIVANSLKFPSATVLLNHHTSSGGVPPAVCTCPGRVFPATFWWTFGPKIIFQNN